MGNQNVGLPKRKSGFGQPKCGVAQTKSRVSTTKNWGWHNRKSGFGQPKGRVGTTENQGLGNQKGGLHNRKVGLAQLFYKMVALKLNLLRFKEKINEQ